MVGVRDLRSRPAAELAGTVAQRDARDEPAVAPRLELLLGGGVQRVDLLGFGASGHRALDQRCDLLVAAIELERRDRLLDRLDPHVGVEVQQAHDVRGGGLEVLANRDLPLLPSELLHGGHLRV